MERRNNIESWKVLEPVMDASSSIDSFMSAKKAIKARTGLQSSNKKDSFEIKPIKSSVS